MGIIELLNNLKNDKEKEEIIDDIIKINEYKIYILKNNSSNLKIRDLILNIINKYRNNIIVRDYYNSNDTDQILYNDYDNLCIIEVMIKKYIIRKIIIDNSNEIIKENKE